MLFLSAAGVGCAVDEGAALADPPETAEAPLPEAKKSACMPKAEACEIGKDACCAGLACIEYTVYDWPRCLPKLADGAACVKDAQCRTGVCGATHLCGPAVASQAMTPGLFAPESTTSSVSPPRMGTRCTATICPVTNAT